jgi:dolichol kinase
MVAESDKTPEEKRKVSNALRVVGTFTMFVACVVLALSLVVPFSLRVIGFLAAIGSVQTVRKHTRRANTSAEPR